eukprot:2324442-Rhodomonas_salina.3
MSREEKTRGASWCMPACPCGERRKDGELTDREKLRLDVGCDQLRVSEGDQPRYACECRKLGVQFRPPRHTQTDIDTNVDTDTYTDTDTETETQTQTHIALRTWGRSGCILAAMSPSMR